MARAISLALPGGVVLDAHAAVDPFPLLVLFPHERAGGIGDEQHRVDGLRRTDGAVEHVEAVTEAERLARPQVRGDLFPVDGRLRGIGQLDQENVPFFCRLRDAHHGKPVRLRLAAGRTLLRRPGPDDHGAAAVPGVRGLRFALDAVPDDGDCPALENRHVHVGIAVDLLGVFHSFTSQGDLSIDVLIIDVSGREQGPWHSSSADRRGPSR